MTTPLCSRARAPMWQPLPTTTCAASRLCSPIGRIAADAAVGTDDAARADASASLDHRQRADRGRCIDIGLRIHDSAWMDADRWRRTCLARPPLGQAGKATVGIVAADDRAAARSLVGERVLHDDTTRCRVLEPGSIARIGEERQRGRIGGVERSDAADAQRGIADQSSTEFVFAVGRQRSNDVAERVAGAHRFTSGCSRPGSPCR